MIYMGFILSKRIIKAHPYGFVGAIIEGRRGIGKSSYCIKIMKETYQTYYDCDDKEAYEYALKNLMFDIDNIIPRLREARKNDEIILALTWDDAGVHGSSMQWFLEIT